MVKIRLAARRLVQAIRRRNSSDDDSSTYSNPTFADPYPSEHLFVVSTTQLFALAEIVARKVAEQLSERIPGL